MIWVEIGKDFKQRPDRRPFDQGIGQACQINFSGKKTAVEEESKPDITRKPRVIYNVDPDDNEFNGKRKKTRERSWKCICTLQCRANRERLHGIYF